MILVCQLKVGGQNLCHPIDPPAENVHNRLCLHELRTAVKMSSSRVQTDFHGRPSKVYRRQHVRFFVIGNIYSDQMFTICFPWFSVIPLSDVR
jgi:hypothetical protein